jgi:SAM-dependent methyltransferase
MDPSTDSPAIWSSRLEAFRESRSHAEGEDLDILIDWCAPGVGLTALDVATGGGHVARRLAAAGCEVTTTDAAAGMKPDIVCPAEALPLADASFDIVACRLAAHHFDDIAKAVHEMARVGRGPVVIEDGLYLGEAVEEAEILRDPTHVRHLTVEEWRVAVEAAGLRVDRLTQVPRIHQMHDWLTLTGCRGIAATRVRSLLAVRTRPDGVWVDEAVVLRAVPD